MKSNPLTSSAGGSPARTSPTPASERASDPTHDRDSGPTSPQPFATYDPNTRWWRTSQLSLLEEWASFSETWPKRGSMLNGQVLGLPMSGPLTAGSESSSLLPTARKSMHKGVGENVNNAASWAKSRLEGIATILLPTPQARDYKGRPADGFNSGNLVRSIGDLSSLLSEGGSE